MKKFVALFEILLLVLTSFTVLSFSAPSVRAAPVCCEKTKAGEFCQYTDEQQCETGLRNANDPSKGTYQNAPTSCDATSFCKPGCCSDELGDGFCYSNTPKANCQLSYGGKFSEQPDCSTVGSCSEGCCILGSQAFLSTSVRCQKEAAKYPSLTLDFKADVKDEASCVGLAKSADKGCCVNSQDNCKYVTRAECSASTNGNSTGFFSGKACSDLGLSTCTCAPADKNTQGKDNTMCIPDDDSVYWKDSCGNPEGIKEKCDYASGTLCGDSNGDRIYTCESVNCKTGDKKLSLDFDSQAKDSVTHDTTVRNGESWCLYDPEIQPGGDGLSNDQLLSSVTGKNLRNLLYASREPVGSRHYRGSCINGKEYVEPCSDFRKDYCLQSSVGGNASMNLGNDGEKFTEAKCTENRAGSCISDCNKADPTKFKKSDGSLDQAAFEQALQEDVQCCTDVSKRDCAWAGTKCVPRVGQGFKHWEGDGVTTCASASLDCSFTVKCNGWSNLFGLCKNYWYPIDGSGNQLSIDQIPCLRKEYVQTANNYCRSYGDCGADYNIAGKLTTEGFSSPPTLGDDFENIVSYAGVDKKTSAYLHEIALSAKNPPRWDIGLGAINFSLPPEQYNAWADYFVGSAWDIPHWLALANVAPYVVVGLAHLAGLTTISAELGLTYLSAPLAGLFAQATATATTATTASAVATLIPIINVALIIYTVYSIVDVANADIQTLSVKTLCKPWSAPVVSNDCEKCNPDYWKTKDGKPTDVNAFKACSEYRCKSLGATCQFINQGTGNETCVSVSKGDAQAPIISPLKEKFEKEYQNNIQTVQQGLEVTKNFTVYTPVVVALQTDEPARCKMSFKPGRPYKEMDDIFFGQSIFQYPHVQPVYFASNKVVDEKGVSLRGGGEYKLYVRCEDAGGNTNEKDYVLKFKVDPQPDATAPVIQATSVGKEVYLTAGTGNNTDVTLYTNEPADCRWSFNPLRYTEMPATQQCTTRPQPDVLGYTCEFRNNTQLGTKPIAFSKPVAAGEKIFTYFKCQDKSPQHNFNKDPYDVTFYGTKPLSITNIEPSGSLFSNLAVPNVTLHVETLGGAKSNGEALCKYTQRASYAHTLSAMDDFFQQTNGSSHEQTLKLSTGDHTFFAGCYDVAGNTAYTNTTFSLLADNTGPTILKAYKSDRPSQLILAVSEDATCQESVTNKNFVFGEGNLLQKDGNVHTSLTQSDVYYIHCKDNYNNIGNVITLTFV